MADFRISELPPLLPADAEGADDLAVADYSSSETRRLSIKGLVQHGVTRLIDDGVLPAGKLVADSVTAAQIAPNAVTTSELADGAVDTAALQDAAVTDAKVAAGIAGGKLVADSVTAREIAPNAVTVSELADNAVDTASVIDGAITTAKLANGIDGSKLAADSITAREIGLSAVGSSELADGAVDTAAIQDGAVTDAKVANVSGTKLSAGTVPNSALAAGIDGAKLTAGSVGNAALGAGLDGAKLGAGTVADAQLATGINGAKVAAGTLPASALATTALDRGLDRTTNAIGHSNSLAAGTRSGISYDAHGHVISAQPLAGADLPAATTTVLGGVSVPADSGLSVSPAGALGHAAAIAAGTTSGVTVNATGHVTAMARLVGTDLPAATATDLGGVSVPAAGQLIISAAGEIGHSNSGVTAGVYPKVTVNATGHVTAGAALTAADVPSIPAEKLSTGVLDPARIKDDSITKEKLADYAVAYIQEGLPPIIDPANHIGQLWYQESTGQLRMFNGNSWMPVGFGRLSQENLRFCGTFDAAANRVLAVTEFGVEAGMAPAAALPVESDGLTGAYLVVTTPGVHAGTAYDNGDWILCVGGAGGTGGTGWIRVDTLNGAGTATIRLADLLDVNAAAPASGDTLIFDATAGKWVSKSTAATKATFIEAIDGTRTGFTLSADAGSVNNILISLGGVLQEPGGDFAFTAPRTINFATAPPAGIEYWCLIEGVSSTGSGGTSLPPGTAARELLEWDPTLSSWQPAATISMGTY